MTTALILLLPIPIGLLVRNRLVAYVSYLAAYSFLFTCQSAMLIVKWAGGSTKAFGPFPKADASDVYSYAVVNAVIVAVALGLLAGSYALAARRRTRSVTSGRTAATAAAPL